MHDPSNVLGKIRSALGRTPGSTVSPPPTIPEPIARLVHSDLGLAELFVTRSKELKTDASLVRVDDLASELLTFLAANGLRKIALSAGGLIERLGLRTALETAGLHVRDWTEITLDELYDGYDCGITDCTYAVAETGSVVIHPTPLHGRALSLVPFYHVVIVEPRNLLPDLLDLLPKARAEGTATHLVMISGPSKTADIEMNVVVGVHGPNVVRAFVLS